MEESFATRIKKMCEMREERAKASPKLLPREREIVKGMERIKVNNIELFRNKMNEIHDIRNKLLERIGDLQPSDVDREMLNKMKELMSGETAMTLTLAA